MTSAVHRRGVEGTAIDSVCRHIAKSIELSYPIYSHGHWMRTGKDRYGPTASRCRARSAAFASNLEITCLATPTELWLYQPRALS
ncbi:MAG: hypothetical protein ACREFV_10930 [Acetobacteraceae bacterium]